MSSDEFDAYDLSEFTSEEFAAIDARVARLLPARAAVSRVEAVSAPIISAAAPLVHVVLESNPSLNASSCATDSNTTTRHRSPVADSPYKRFCSWKKAFAVTQLIGPVWCELQYEYGLYSQKYKTLRRRPSSFKSRNGKVVHIHKDRATESDRRLKQGKSTHQALEDEMRREEIVVVPTTPEERFGLRLLRLIDGFCELVGSGKTRELPVLGLIHGHPVVGVIDEIVKSYTPPESKKRNNHDESDGNDGSRPVCASHDAYTLKLVDYKTRRFGCLPPEEDMEPSKLQLMLYHRMLSALLVPETFDFDQFWLLMDLDPAKPFSGKFVQDVHSGAALLAEDLYMDLNSLVSQWIAIVGGERTRDGCLRGVDTELQLVYRWPLDRSGASRSRRKDAKERARVDDPLALQEELDMARAVEESLRQFNKEETGGMTTSKIGEQLAQRASVSCAERPTTTTEVFQSAHFEEPKEPKPPSLKVLCEVEQDVLTVSPIIGTKEFTMDEGMLDRRLEDVLQWWFGARRPRGVTDEQTYRCDTCEYQASCEWREDKMKQADRRNGLAVEF